MSVPLPNPLPPGTIHPPPACNLETAARTQDLVASAAPSDLALRRAAAAAGERVHHLDLPPEVSLAEAASIANCDKKTIIRYMRDGLLEWRNIAPPSSSRPTYRVKLASVIALRTNYQQGNPQHGRHVDDPPSKAPPPRGRAPGRHQFKHIWVGRG
jgi:hypothetical protein